MIVNHLLEETLMKSFNKIQKISPSSYQTPVTDVALTPSLGVPDDKENKVTINIHFY